MPFISFTDHDFAFQVHQIPGSRRDTGVSRREDRRRGRHQRRGEPEEEAADEEAAAEEEQVEHEARGCGAAAARAAAGPASSGAQTEPPEYLCPLRRHARDQPGRQGLPPMVLPLTTGTQLSRNLTD